ncbi:hypothetical protein [uncultured Pantoea sp.]|uniref:hypothetical protein n=1 Tax=uncultured Pantoea sp. TaxID=218084 RepID=UPI0025FBEDFD|nr:hypothetical protein [uncultured Pantoea sp.]
MLKIIEDMKHMQFNASLALSEEPMPVALRMRYITEWCLVASPQNVMKLVSQLENGEPDSPPFVGICHAGGDRPI